MTCWWLHVFEELCGHRVMWWRVTWNVRRGSWSPVMVGLQLRAVSLRPSHPDTPWACRRVYPLFVDTIVAIARGCCCINVRVVWDSFGVREGGVSCVRVPQTCMGRFVVVCGWWCAFARCVRDGRAGVISRDMACSKHVVK